MSNLRLNLPALGREKAHQSVGNLLDDLDAWRWDVAPRDAGQRVVSDVAAAGNLSPRSIALVSGQKLDDVCVSHSVIMPIRLAIARPIRLTGLGTMATMEKKALNHAQQAVAALIEGSQLSVNAWALKHKLVQSTINRVVTGKMDPTTELLRKIAEAVGLEPWQLLVTGFDPKSPPVLAGALSHTDRALIATFKIVQQEAAETVGDHGSIWAGEERRHPGGNVVSLEDAQHRVPRQVSSPLSKRPQPRKKKDEGGKSDD